MVCVQVGTDGGMDARRTLTYLTGFLVLSSHAIHIGRGTAKVAQVTAEIIHLTNLVHFPQDAFLASAADELALVGTDGAESASAETTAMDVHGMFNHVVGGNAFALILGMGQTGERQVVNSI